MKTLEERFWAKVDTSAGLDCCWLWTARCTPGGYGQLRVGKTMRYAHRLSYEMSTGEQIGELLQIDHICHRRACVNPAHLRVVTRKENAEYRQGAQSNSKSRILGVSWDRDRRRWRAEVKHHGKPIHVGRFTSIEEAAEAARLKRCELFTHNDKDRLAA